MVKGTPTVLAASWMHKCSMFVIKSKVFILNFSYFIVCILLWCARNHHVENLLPWLALQWSQNGENQHIWWAICLYSKPVKVAFKNLGVEHSTFLSVLLKNDFENILKKKKPAPPPPHQQMSKVKCWLFFVVTASLFIHSHVFIMYWAYSLGFCSCCILCTFLC